MNWRGRPLTSHDVIVNTIAATTTDTGVKIPDKRMRALKDNGTLVRHDWHGEWNYTIHPRTDTPEPD